MQLMIDVAALWDVTSCSSVAIYCRFRGKFCLHYQGKFS